MAHNYLDLAGIFGSGQRRSGTLRYTLSTNLSTSNETTACIGVGISRAFGHCSDDVPKAQACANSNPPPRFETATPDPLRSGHSAYGCTPRLRHPQRCPAMAESSGTSACCDALSGPSSESRWRWRRREERNELEGDFGEFVYESIVRCDVDHGGRIGSSVSSLRMVRHL